MYVYINTLFSSFMVYTRSAAHLRAKLLGGGPHLGGGRGALRGHLRHAAGLPQALRQGDVQVREREEPAGQVGRQREALRGART